MSKNRIIVGIVAVILIVAAGFTTQSAIATARVLSTTRSAQADAADVARWVAMGEYYTKLAASESGAEEQRILDNEAARLEAMGKYYTALQASEALKLAQVELVASARYTGQALEQYERTGDPSFLPTCLSADVMAELPANIGDNSWKSQVPACEK